MTIIPPKLPDGVSMSDIEIICQEVDNSDGFFLKPLYTYIFKNKKTGEIYEDEDDEEETKYPPGAFRE